MALSVFVVFLIFIAFSLQEIQEIDTTFATPSKIEKPYIYYNTVFSVGATLAVAIGETSQIKVQAQIDPISAELEGFQINKTYSCDCISWVKSYFPHLKNTLLYSPKWLWNNYEDYGLRKTDKVVVGAIIILTDNPYYWHAGLVQKRNDDEITIYEKNIKGCWVSKRILKITDEKIIGYLY